MAIAADYISLVLKGTRHGLLASIREDADWSIVVSELSTLSSSGEGFLSDASLTFDLGWREVTESQFDQLIETLHQQGLNCNGILSTSLNTRTIAEDRGYRAIIGRLGLAKHQGRQLRREQEAVVQIPVADVPETVLEPQKPVPVLAVENLAKEEFIEETVECDSIEISVETSLEEQVSTPSQEGIHVPRFQDEEPTLYLRKTLRSGQKVVFGGNVVLLGDLNPGAQIEADGDIIVMGQLRGTVHAGAEGDESAAVITSSLKPTQLRIADRFWSGEKNNSYFKKNTTTTGTVRARLEGDSIVLEALPVR